MHSYADHVSILKFIERNWHLQAAHGSQPRQSAQSDRARHDNAYVPTNMPAIGDLFDMFDFDHHDDMPYPHHRWDDHRRRWL